MTEENTEETNSQHIKSHDAALASLRACFALYQEWQDGTGDWDTFVDWIDDERPWERCAHCNYSRPTVQWPMDEPCPSCGEKRGVPLGSEPDGVVG